METEHRRYTLLCNSFDVDGSELVFFSFMIHRKCGDLGSALKVFDEMPKRNMAVSDCIHG